MKRSCNYCSPANKKNVMEIRKFNKKKCNVNKKNVMKIKNFIKKILEHFYINIGTYVIIVRKNKKFRYIPILIMLISGIVIKICVFEKKKTAISPDLLYRFHL